MRKKAWCAVALTTAATIAAALWLIVPLAVGGGTNAKRAAATDPCELVQPQPAHPLEANTVAVGALFKTVAMEKETFACTVDPNFPPTQLRDVETFIEIVEAATRDGVKVVEKRVESATCIKDLAGQGGWVVRCSTEPVALAPPGNPAIPGDCRPSPDQPADPVDMDTAVGANDRFVKTVKVEKEVFFCSEDVVADVYLFTEIIEAQTRNAAGAVGTVRPIAKEFEGIVCFKRIIEPRLTGCRQIGPLS